MTSRQQPGISHQAAEEAAIRRVESAYDDAWKRGDIDALVDCLTEDAVIINPLGETAIGREQIRRELGAFLGGAAKGSRHATRVVRVQLLTDDVAIFDGEAVVEAMAEGPRTILHRFTDILVKKEGAWKIAHVRACRPRDSGGAA